MTQSEPNLNHLSHQTTSNQISPAASQTKPISAPSTTAPVRYVLTFIANPELSHVVGQLKLKGPSHLINKISFPGGKIEANETIEQAASRETLEETGLIIEPAQWTVFDSLYLPTHHIHKLFCIHETIETAKTMECEPIFSLNIQLGLQTFELAPHLYTSDFKQNCLQLLAFLQKSKIKC